MSILSKLKNLIRNGRQTLPMEDLGKFPKAQVKSFTEIKKVKNITPYGFYCSPVLNSQWIIFESRGNNDDLQGIGNDYENRPSPLLTGEVQIKNLLTGAFAKFDALGNITVSAPPTPLNPLTSVNVIAPVITATATSAITATAPVITATASTSVAITAPLTTITGNVVITGVLTLAGVNMNSHVHKENDIPNDTDGPKNP
jgi:phage baseplate assembly protein gpV